MAKVLLRALSIATLAASVACTVQSTDPAPMPRGNPAPGAAADPPAPGSADIVDTAIAAGNFKTLAAALTKANLVETLKGPGPFTVFAPTDAAFAKLKAEIGDAAFNGILADKAALTSILTYHVVSGSVYQKDVAAGNVKTLQGDNIVVSTTGGVKLNDASNVVLTDLPNRNGVIHVIDTVLLPPEKK